MLLVEITLTSSSDDVERPSKKNVNRKKFFQNIFVNKIFVITFGIV
jgi:hypothetical protein